MPFKDAVMLCAIVILANIFFILMAPAHREWFLWLMIGSLVFAGIVLITIQNPNKKRKKL